MTEGLPWALEFKPLGPTPGLEIEHGYDPATNRLSVSLRNTGSVTLEPLSLVLAAEVTTPAASGYAWINRGTDESLVRRCGEPFPPDARGEEVLLDFSPQAVEYDNASAIALNLPVKPTPVLVAGVLVDHVSTSISVRLTPDESTFLGLHIQFILRGVSLAPGAQQELATLLLVEGREVPPLVEAYAAAVADEMHAHPPETTPVGWCSWHTFFRDVDEDAVVRNAVALRDGGQTNAYVVIDDGWQARIGDWLSAGGGFPGGMAAAAGRIREAGQRPGLWFAPFLLHEDSATLREHPDWALTDASGARLRAANSAGSHAVLDVDNADAAAWLRDVVCTMVAEWGFELLKIDNLSAGSGADGHEPGRVRRCLEIIREAAGEDVFLLGCGSPLGPAVGLVDGMRVGPDVERAWSNPNGYSRSRALRIALMHYWMHGRWWVNDPDALLLAGATPGEARFHATAVALSGGMVLSGDDIPSLAPERAEMLWALMPSTGVAAVPLDPSESPVPSTWRADLGDGRFLVGAFNWSEGPRWIAVGELLRPGEVAFSVWDAAAVGMGDVHLEPHDAVLWQVRAPGRSPRIVGDSGSVTFAGLFERQVSGRVQVRNDGRRPRVVAIEARGRVFEVDLEPGQPRWFD